jgi:hypothetical protein
MADLVGLDVPPIAGGPRPAIDWLDVTPLCDEALRYVIGQPRGWRCAQQLGEYLDLPTVQRPIGVFGCGGPPHGQAMTVTTTPMQIEIRIEDWVRHVFERADWLVHDQRWHDADYGPRLVTWGTCRRVVMGTVAFADAGRILMTHCIGALDRQPEVALTLWSCAMPLRMRQPAGAGRLEGRIDVGCGEYGFEMPYSWRTRSESAGASWARADVDLVDPRGGPPPATLRVRVGGDPNVPVETRRRQTASRLAKAGWVPSLTITEPDELWRARPGGFELRELRARSRSGALADLRIAHGEHDGVAVEIIVACGEGRPRCWMRAKRALEIAAETLGPRRVPTQHA